MKIDDLPDIIQGPVLTIIAIVIGYFISLITKFIFSSVFPFESSKNGPTYNAFERINLHLAHLSFWGPFCAFTIWGYTHSPLLFSSLKKWQISADNSPSLVIICLGAILIGMSEKWIIKICKACRQKIGVLPKIKFSNTLAPIYIVIFLSAFALLMQGPVDQPRNIGWKISVSILVLFFGYFLGGIIKHVISNLIGIENTNESLVARFIKAFVLATFALTTFEIWLLS